ncbi:hypothetical protein [Aeromonas caviae]|uniref:hypothetical protein n=1 Tax=Aeromonas caviae TaxID=648 RepID=UPI0038D10F04
MVILLLLWRAEGYHQSAVGHLSPFIHECRTYYLNSRFIGSEIPSMQLIDVLQQLGKGSVSVESINEMVSDKGISSYLSDASNIITVAEKIYEWYTSGTIGDVLSQLRSMVG